MSTLYTAIAVTAAIFNLGSGILSFARLKIIYPLLDGAGIPHSWLMFPIGTLKLAGGLGIIAGLVVSPVIGTAAAAGLVLFWTCAVYTHVLTNFWPRETVLTFTFLALAVGSLATGLMR